MKVEDLKKELEQNPDGVWIERDKHWDRKVKFIGEDSYFYSSKCGEISDSLEWIDFWELKKPKKKLVEVFEVWTRFVVGGQNPIAEFETYEAALEYGKNNYETFKIEKYYRVENGH